MRLGVLTVLFGQQSLDEALDYIKKVGVEIVELATGNYLGNAHCNPNELLINDGKLKTFKKKLEDRGMEISALSCHGNPLHPQEAIAKEHKKIQRKTILLAEKLGVERVITFSGCPSDTEVAKHPNWVTCPWPFEVAAGNDAVALRKKYGKDLIIGGTIDKRALIKGKEAIREEVMSKVPFLLEQGGYFPSVDHAVPPDVTFENYCYYINLMREVAGLEKLSF